MIKAVSQRPLAGYKYYTTRIPRIEPAKVRRHQRKAKCRLFHLRSDISDTKEASLFGEIFFWDDLFEKPEMDHSHQQKGEEETKSIMIYGHT